MTCFRAIFRKSFSDKITPGRDDLTPRDATSVKKMITKGIFFLVRGKYSVCDSCG